MQITIIKKNKLSLFTLPEKPNGSHWLTDFENGRKINLINIEAQDQGWKLISNHDAFILDQNNIMVPNVTLKNYNFYLLKNNYRNEQYYLYCAPTYDKSYKELGIQPGTIIHVGNGKNNDINYPINGVAPVAYEISKQEKYYYLTIKDNNSFVYVNQKRVNYQQRLEYGDIIFMLGLKVILMKHDGADYLLVNNPNNQIVFNAFFVNVVTKPVAYEEDNATLSEDSLYEEDKYFYRTPHFYKALEKYIVKIDSPPTKKEEDKTPAVLTIGPMITMAMMSVVMLISTVNQVNSGQKDWSNSWTSIVMCIVMLASSLLWPLLTKAYQKFQDKMYEKKRQKLYKNYIDKKEHEIIVELESQKKSLLDNNYSIQQCQDIIRGHNVRLWQRRITDEDFLTLPVGYGNVPMQLEVQYPEEHFSLTEDNLLDIAHELGKKERILSNVPITYSFYENIATGIVGEPVITKEFIDRIILQAMTHYSYDELKIITFTSKENEDAWDYIKTLPHSWSNDRAIRFFGSSLDDYREIIYYLEQIWNERRNSKKEGKYETHYLIITDAIKSIDNYDFIKNVMNQAEKKGFSLVMLVDRVSACPNECKNFINVNKGECSIFNSIINSAARTFKIDFTPLEELYNCAKELANIKIEIKTETETNLPDVYHFLEMYQVGKVEQLNSFDRWKKSNPMLSLQVPIGIGKSGEIINLDLHEKYHGPHGLVAGTTGSGKSEFIITYILSLAVNYSPYEVQIILIDYKGGSLAGSFQNDKFSLPHLAGTITNLDGNELNRSLASIESEIKRRQREFNEARIMANESSIDIYKYQKLFREGRLKGKEPIAHLFIISDEFAELKEQQPEFMEKLISTARVGRSLGIHLILATQKPGGVVDPQIWSNTRFRVCLKVQDTGDSQEVLKKPDAAYLKKTGRFYLQVGYDEVYRLGQSAWAGGQYYPSTTFKKDVDTSINAINNIGFITTTKDVEVTKKVESKGEELPNIVKYLSDIAIEEKIKIRKLWLEKIPAKIYVDSLKSKYNFVKTDYNIDILIGEYDDPTSQNQFALTLPFTEQGNMLVYGMAGSGKEMLLVGLIYSGITTYRPEELNFYILDFGSETLRMFKNAPHVGDIVFLDEKDKIINLFKMLNEELTKRKNLFANYGGNYASYIKNSEEKLPSIIVALNNYEAFIENYEDINEELAGLTREAYKYGIYFLITASNENSVRLKIKQNCNFIFALQQNNDSEYSNILGNCRGKIPAKLKGRGLFKKEKIYEFQTASITEEENISAWMKEIVTKMRNEYKYTAKKIPVLPEEVDYSSIENEIKTGTNLIVGINSKKLNVEKFNFGKNVISLISAYEIEQTEIFLNALINQIGYTKSYDMLFLNTTEKEFKNEYLNGLVYTKNFDEVFTKIGNYIDRVYEVYEKNNFDEKVLKAQKKICCFFYGIYDLMNKVSDDTKKKFAEMLKKDNQMNLVAIIIVDNPDILKGFAYEDWFRLSADTARGIWIGSGVADESLFKISKVDREDREEISNEYGYIIQNSKLNRIKLLTSFVPPNEEKINFLEIKQ